MLKIQLCDIFLNGLENYSENFTFCFLKNLFNGFRKTLKCIGDSKNTTQSHFERYLNNNFKRCLSEIPSSFIFYVQVYQAGKSQGKFALYVVSIHVDTKESIMG